MDLPGEVLNSLAQLLMIAALSIVQQLPLAFRLVFHVLFYRQGLVRCRFVTRERGIRKAQKEAVSMPTTEVSSV